MRIARLVRHLAAKFNLASPWRFETAAMLSQLGCVTLDPGIMRTAFAGERLSAEDQARFTAHPQVAKNLLIHIPRMETIAWMIGRQLIKESSPDDSDRPEPHSESIVFGAKILKLAVAFEKLKMKGMTDEDALAWLRFQRDEFGTELVAALSDFSSAGVAMHSHRVSMSKLMTGMVLQQEIRTPSGTLIVQSGQEITRPSDQAR